jgi:hypothetical protein
VRCSLYVAAIVVKFCRGRLLRATINHQRREVHSSRLARLEQHDLARLLLDKSLACIRRRRRRTNGLRARARQ